MTQGNDPSPSASPQPTGKPSGIAGLLKTVAKVEPPEVRAVLVAFVYFFFLMASYFIVRPVRDTMGSVYGVKHLQELFTGTFVLSFIVAPVYAGLASRIRLARFLPWVYGFIALTLVGFYALFRWVPQGVIEVPEHPVLKLLVFLHLAGATAQVMPGGRLVAAAFYVWVSTFNLLTISVFWSLMADIFASGQAKRLFGFIAGGGTVGTICAPLFVQSAVERLGTNNMLLVSAAGFVVTALLVGVLEREKRRLVATDPDAQKTVLDRDLGSTGRRRALDPFQGFLLLFRSPYLLMIALFILLMTTISTVIYFQLQDVISHEFVSRAARTKAFADIDLATNACTVLVQLFGTGRIISRFGVTVGLLLNPLIMVVAFLGVVFSPVLLVLGTIQVVRRFAEYAIARPSREMCFTVVDQESKYKAKNVIDTVVYRFGDVTSAWLSAAVLPYGVTGLAVAGIVFSVIWFPIAWLLGRRYESARGAVLTASPVAASH